MVRPIAEKIAAFEDSLNQNSYEAAQKFPKFLEKVSNRWSDMTSESESSSLNAVKSLAHIITHPTILYSHSHLLKLTKPEEGENLPPSLISLMGQWVYNNGASSGLLRMPLLHAACVCNDTQWVSQLLGEGVNLHERYQDKTPLFAAASQGHHEVVSLLIKHDPSIIHDRDQYLNTPLHPAVQSDSLECVQLLIDNGCPIDEKNSNGLTPLVCKFAQRSKEIISALLRVGANPDIAIDSQSSAFSYFVGINDIELTELFITTGANPNFFPPSTALHTSFTRIHSDFFSLFRGTQGATERLEIAITIMASLLNYEKTDVNIVINKKTLFYSLLELYYFTLLTKPEHSEKILQLLNQLICHPQFKRDDCETDLLLFGNLLEIQGMSFSEEYKNFSQAFKGSDKTDPEFVTQINIAFYCFNKAWLINNPEEQLQFVNHLVDILALLFSYPNANVNCQVQDSTLICHMMGIYSGMSSQMDLRHSKLEALLYQLTDHPRFEINSIMSHQLGPNIISLSPLDFYEMIASTNPSLTFFKERLLEKGALKAKDFLSQYVNELIPKLNLNDK